MKISPLNPWIQKKIFSTRPELTRDEIEAWQLKKLNETLALARECSQFYRQSLSGIPIPLSQSADIFQIPFTTPDEIRRNALQFVCVSQSEIRRVVTLQTSGTTGRPKRIYFTNEDQELTIDFFKVGMSTLTGPLDRVLILLPCKTPGSVGDLLRIGLERLGAIPIPYGPVCDPSNALETMNTQRVDCLVASPTQALGLARRWQSGMYKPHSVLLSTDYVPNAIVKALVGAWDCEVFNHYGATEMGLGGGVECAAHSGYHLREADLYFEIIDPQSGTPLQEGEYGEVVFTTLTRRGMPLIRYRTGDRSRFLPGKCPCGANLRTLEVISGRFDGFLVLEEGILKISDLDEALFTIPELLNFQASLVSRGSQTILHIDAQTLTNKDLTKQIEYALHTISPIRNLEIMVRSQYCPHEPGSLVKRVILDKRK